jgi:signal transduction histidine kinase
MAESARLLYEIHKTSGDLPTALRYLEIYQSINSELLSAEKATAIANLEAVAELQRKKEQIDFLTNQRWLERVILAIVLMLLGLTVVFVIWIQRERQRVMSLANKLKDVGAQKDRILSIISHDLRGPLASLSSVIELLDMDLLSPDDWKELKPSLIRQFNGTDETLQDLLTWAKSQFEGVGMSAERRDKLFEGSGHTTLGTSGESGSGLGLVFVRDLVQRNGGRISVESTEGKGSVFTVALPMG